MKVEIVRSTDKAHLVQNESGERAWIQKRWLKADGTVKDSTFEKNAEKLEEAKQASIEANAFKTNFHPLGTIDRESERAIAVEAIIERCGVDWWKKSLIWFPKSQVKDGAVQGWLMQAKAKELREKVTTNLSGDFMVEMCGESFFV